MAGQKLTEKQLAALVKTGANFVITQPEGDAGNEIESVRRVQIGAVISALRAQGLMQGYPTSEQVAEAMGEFVNDISLNNDRNGLVITYGEGSTVTIPIATGGGGADLSELHWEWDSATGYLHMLDEEDIDVMDPVWIGGGGSSGGGSALTFAVYTSPTFSVIESTGSAEIEYRYASIDKETDVPTGPGNMAIYVGGVMKTNISVPQGDHQTVDIFRFLSSGTNSVQLTITDSYGNSATRKFTVIMESFMLEWSLNNTVKNTEDSLSFYVTPLGSGSKTIYTYLDGVLHSTNIITTSGRRLTKTINNLSHGHHTVEVYGVMTVEGSSVESNHLVAAIAQVISNTPVVAAKWPSGNLTQYTTAQIRYMVCDPASNPTTVSLAVNDVIQSTIQVDQSEQIWAYRPIAAGTVKLSIICQGVITEKTFTVSSIGDDVEQITDGLAIKVDPAIISDLSTWSYGGYTFTLSDEFDLVNGGIQADEQGIHCIRITAGDRLTLNYPLFSGDARRTGKEAKIIYKIKNSSNKEAVGISCLSNGIGLTAKANNVYLSGDQTMITLSVCEDEKTELDINIQQDSEDKLMFMWEKCSTFAYSQYASNESFTQGTAQGITFGSDDADVYLYLFRAYNRDLTNDEIKTNYIYDGADGAEILTRRNRNGIYDGSGNINLETAQAQNPDAHFLIINAERMTLGKKDAVSGTLTHVCVNGGTEDSWTADMTMVVQGTSSVEHAPTAGPNINFTLDNIITSSGTELTDGYAMNGALNSIPTKLLCFKKNIASEEHVVNRAIAEWYNRFQPSLRAARANDSRVRDCLESTMAVVFFHNTGSSAVTVGPDVVQPDETIFFGLGNLCSNKDAAEVFEYDDIVIEVKNNTEDQVRFKSDDLSGQNFGNNYEFRYLNENVYTEEQAKELWQEVQTFIFETDWTAATNTALSRVVTINGQAFSVDSAAYRKAKWTAEAPSLFDMDTLYFHYNITLFFLLRDNRAKNMFWSRNSQEKWGLWFNWDNDTGLCRNNEGYIDIEPGYMDFDTIGTADVYNGADNALWTNLRECNAAALRQNYLDMESAGAWNIDAFYAYCMESQEQICESLWIEDAEHNAIRTMQNLGTTAYLERATARLRLHLKKALTFQKALVDSYYNCTAATADSASFRGYTPSSWAGVEPSGLLAITPYTDMYINILAGSINYQERAYAGEPVTIDLSSALNDTEIYLRSAAWIQELGDMSGMYLGQFEASRLKRIKRLLIGSDEEGYYNTNFTTASFDNCVKLEELNLGGLQNAARAFDFSANIYLKKLFTKGSGITGITFAKNGRLNEAKLNAIASLFMSGLRLLETFEIEGYDNLTSIAVENSPAVDSYAIANAARNLERVRLLDIDWHVPVSAYDLLVRLHNIHGIDDEGYDAQNGVITGEVYFNSISQTKYNTIVALIPEVDFAYIDLLEEVTVTFKNTDGTTLYVGTTERGGAIADPIAAGLIPTPTQAPTADYIYTYYQWDTSLDYIAQDTIVTAVYTRTAAQYTVRFLDYDGTVLQSSVLAAHETISYIGEDLQRSGYIWTGWDAVADDVVTDMDIHATYSYPTMPSSVKDLTVYDYAYSDDPNDRSAYSFGELYSIIKTGRTADYLPIGTKIKMFWEAGEITDSYAIFSLHSIGHYELTGGGMSKADFYMTHVLISNRRMNPSNTNSGGWDTCEMRTWLNGTLYRKAPSHWRALITEAYTLASAGAQSSVIRKSADYFRLPSHAEIGFDTGAVPYRDEINSNAAEVAFSVYTNNNSRIKKNYYGDGTAQYWWTRSADSGSSTNFRNVHANGNAGSNAASNTNGVCVGFCAG